MYKRLILLIFVLLFAAACAAPAGDSGATTTETDSGASEAAGEEMAEPGEPKQGGILTYGLVGDPPALDPHTQRGAADATVKAQVYDTLLTWDREMNAVPRLAESWEIVDDTTIQFKLREGVKFHDGSEMTAEDVVFSYERIQNPDTGATAAGFLKDVTFEVIDTYTVQMNLPAPNAAIFQNLCRGDTAIVSKAWVEGGADLNQEMMGTGPFTYVGREPGVSLEIARNPDYFRAPLPYLDGVKFIPYADETAKVTAIRTGEIDFIDYVPWIDMDEIEGLANAG
ncbi:MAG: ABC transporter substrate-binding protein [Caldilineaceae bacterium]